MSKTFKHGRWVYTELGGDGKYHVMLEDSVRPKQHALLHQDYQGNADYDPTPAVFDTFEAADAYARSLHDQPCVVGTQQFWPKPQYVSMR